MSKNTPPVYDESKVKTLSSLEHIRTRPGMYVGRLGNGQHTDDGIYVLLKEVIDNCVDEFIMGSGKKIEISISEQGEARIRDYGRGIPLGKLIDCVSEINTGAKYNTEVFQFSVGLNGVGLKAVNALSLSFIAKTVRDGKYRQVVFEDGELQSDEEGKTEEKDGTEVAFRPNPEFFEGFQFLDKLINRRLWNYAYLNSGLSLYYNDQRFYSRRGIYDLLSEKISDESIYDIIYHKDDDLEFAFCHTSTFGETYYSFVNGQYTNDGGTHLSAFREGLLKGVKEFAAENFDVADVRNGVMGAVAVKVQEPVFESQTKNKLGNNEIRTDIVNRVKKVVAELLYKNADTAEALMEKIKQNEKVRKEIQVVKKEAKAKAKKAKIKIPNLRDCKYHLTDGNEKGSRSLVFLTEGQSAAGSMISCRDVETQAIYCLKGKPLNCYGRRRKTVYRNEELYFIMSALDIEEDLDNLRYEKIVIATDADVDGLHIRNLLITFFLTFFEQLVLSEHLYILETPLFRVRDRKETIYCYSAAEMARARKKLGASCETTRFKGLGEISPNEFGQFIGDEMRLLRVSVDSTRIVPGMLDFFMGRNNPERKHFIMDNLV